MWQRQADAPCSTMEDARCTVREHADDGGSEPARVESDVRQAISEAHGVHLSLDVIASRVRPSS